MIIVVSDSLIEKAFLKIFFESHYNQSPKFTKINKLKSHELKEYKMIIFGDFINPKEVAQSYSYLLKNNIKIPILYNKSVKESPLEKKLCFKAEFHYYDYEDMEVINNFIPKYTVTKDYFLLDNIIFKYMHYLPCNIYQKKVNKFDLYLETNDTTTTFDDSLDYYIKKDDYMTLFAQLDFNLKRNNFKPSTVKQGIKKEKELFAAAETMAYEVGVSSNTIAAVNELINEIFSQENTEDIFKVINKIYEKKFFITEHSLMCAYLGLEMLKHLNEEDPILKRKLITASIVHDLCISAKFKELEESNLPQGSPEFYEHSNKIIKFLERFPRADEELKNMCKYHHELPKGGGPNHVFASELSRMEYLFNMIHFFIVDYYQTKDKKRNLKSMIKEDYQGNRELFRALCEICNLPFFI